MSISDCPNFPNCGHKSESECNFDSSGKKSNTMGLRLYSFCNFYISQIQGGIQTAHLVHELFNKYGTVDNSKGFSQLDKWSRNHKTIIVLNGGPNEYLRSRWMMFQRELSAVEDEIKCKLPWSSFNEDEFSLGGVMTCVGVVLPECIFDAVDYKTAMNTLPDGKTFADVFASQRNGSYFWLQENVEGDKYVSKHYKTGSATSRLIADVKSCRLF